MEEEKKQLIEKIGIVKAIMPPRGVWNSFTLQNFKQADGVKDIFISTKKELDDDLKIEKGDEVKITYSTQVNGQYVNYYLSSCEVLKKESAQVVQTPLQTPNTSNVTNVSNNTPVDSGNAGKPFNKVAFFAANTGEELGEKLSVFGETHNVFATQTHYSNPGWGAFAWYKATVRELLEKEEFPVVKPGQ